MFRRWGEIVVARPRLVLVAVLLAVALLAWQTRHLRLSIREQDQLPQSHPYVQIYNRLNHTFGGGEVALIGLIVHDGDIFNRDTLAKVARITRAVERMPEAAHGAVWSIAAERVKHIGASGDDLDIRRLMPSVPESDADLARLRREVLDDPLLVGSMVSADGRATAIVADLPADIVPPVVVATLRAIADRERDDRTDVVLGGGPVILDALDHYTAQMAILFPLAVVVIGLVHYEAFRTVQAMFLPLLTAILSVLSALGIMGMIGLPLDTWSTITPVAILAVAAGHAVQILKRYYEDYAELGDNREAVVASIAHVGPVMVTAGIVASAGFASLATFTVTSVRVFGLLMACGIMSALVIEMTFIPAYRALLPAPRGREAARERESRLLTGALRWLAGAVVHHPWRVLVAAGLIVVAALPGVGMV
ncbi:MAG TPA: MMPL family transporter, partial [Dongiaceae bacterium]|nr:MMPL family transporter [Dongiaceae bacterium]